MFKNFLLTSSSGNGKFPLTSFDDALYKSKVGNYNLLKVSSILPAGCKQYSNINVVEGAPLHIAYASITSNKKNDYIASAVGVGIPQDRNKVGVIMEYSDYTTEVEVREVVKSMVIEAMEKRCYQIKEILIVSCGAKVDGEEYITAFSGLAMW